MKKFQKGDFVRTQKDTGNFAIYARHRGNLAGVVVSRVFPEDHLPVLVRLVDDADTPAWFHDANLTLISEREYLTELAAFQLAGVKP